MIKFVRISSIAGLLLVLGYLDLFASHPPAAPAHLAQQKDDRPRVAGPGGAGLSAQTLEGRYDLRSRRILTQVILLIKENYVDPSRVKPYDMLLAALDYIEKTVAEILVDETGAPDHVKISVGGVTREFDLSITYAWEIGYKLRDVFEFIQDNISAEQDLKDIEYAAINGMLSTLDPHSVLLKPENFDEVKMATKGEFGGLGISIAVRDGALTIISPMDGTPAARAGLKALDKIVQIGEESTVNMNIEEAVQRLRGKPGTRISISILRPGWTEAKKFILTRANIKIESVTSELLSGETGYIKVKSFQSNTSEDVSNHLDRLKTKTKGKLKGLVLDLRNNPGGLLDQAIYISDLFIAHGPLVITVGEGNKKREEKSASLHGTESELPLAVLINGGSASASEIVAGALKNHNRAVVLGQQSFGKGSVQVLYDFKDQSALKLTIAQYLTPGDVSIQSIGITPDVLLYPGVVDKVGVRLFAHADYPREKDLDKHLDRQNNEHKGNTDAPPTETMTYLVDKQKDEEAQDEEAPESPPAPEKFVEDYEIRFARELLAKAVTPDRKRILENAGPLFKKQEQELEDKIAKALSGLGVDWSKGAKATPAETVIDVKLQLVVKAADKTFKPVSAQGPGLDPARVKAGEEVMLVATARNTSSEEAHRVYGVTSSDNPIFDKREFIFGRLGPQESRTWAQPIKVPKDLFARVDEVKIKLEGVSQPPNSGRLVATIDELPRPHFAYSWQLRDEVKGNGDGLLDPGEEVDLVVGVKNTGRGISQDTYVTLKNLSGEALYIDQGRAKLGALNPGDEREVTMHFVAKKEAKKESGKNAEMKLSVVDMTLNEQLTEKLSFNLGDEGRVIAKVEPRKVSLKTTRDKAPLLAAASELSDTLAAIPRGTLVKGAAFVTVGGRSYYRVTLDKRQGFITASDVENTPAATGKDKKLELSFVHSTPDIAIADGIRGTRTATPTLPLKGVAMSARKMRDVYIFVNEQKVFYQSTQKDEPGKDGAYKHAFETVLPLKVGTNTVTVVAREDEETAARQTFVLFREGEVPVASTGAKNDKQ
jgi:carboxyl-terminal processing protease